MTAPIDLPLTGLRVIELGEGVSAAYCTRTLALLGAEVWKIESPTGDGARLYGPFRNDVVDAEGSGLFMYLNVMKRGLTLNLSHPSAGAVLGELVGHADVVVENIGQTRLSRVGAAFEQLRDWRPDILVGSLTPFGLTGPRADDEATHLSIFHAGGEGFTLPGGTGYKLFPDREPVQSAPMAAHYDAGTVAAVAVLSVLLGRTISGAAEAELLDISEQEAQLGINRVEMQRYPQGGFIESRATRDMPVGDLFQAADGYIAIEPLEWHMWEGLCQLIGKPELLEDDRFSDRDRLYKNGHEANDFIAEWAIGMPKDQAYHATQAHRCASGPVRSPRDLFESEQLRTRGFFSELEGEDLQVPHTPFRLFDGPSIPAEVPRRLKPAPTLGRDNLDIYRQYLGWTEEDCAWQLQAGLI